MTHFWSLMQKHLNSSYLFSEPQVDPELSQNEPRYLGTLEKNLVEKHRLECPYYSATDRLNPRILQSKNRKMKFSRLFGLRPSPTVNNTEDLMRENRGKLWSFRNILTLKYGSASFEAVFNLVWDLEWRNLHCVAVFAFRDEFSVQGHLRKFFSEKFAIF